MAPTTWQVLKMLAVIILPAILPAQKVVLICRQPSPESLTDCFEIPRTCNLDRVTSCQGCASESSLPPEQAKLFQDRHLSSPQTAGTPQEKHQSPSRDVVFLHIHLLPISPSDCHWVMTEDGHQTAASTREEERITSPSPREELLAHHRAADTSSDQRGNGSSQAD